MFGGLAFLLRGHLLCGARHDGMMVRLGQGQDAWALAMPGVTRLRAGDREMPGWVRVPSDLCAEDTVRRRFLGAALAITKALPPKWAGRLATPPGGGIGGREGSAGGRR
jgi:hypothetical protein